MPPQNSKHYQVPFGSDANFVNHPGAADIKVHPKSHNFLLEMRLFCNFSFVYSSSTTNDFRYTHRSTDYRPITPSTAGRGCHVSLCWGLPLVRFRSSNTCGVLDGLTATADQNVRSYDVSCLHTGNEIFFPLSI